MAERILPDVNATTIQLVDDHPGHPYIRDALEPTYTGEAALLMFGYLPLRIQWVLDDLGFDTVAARTVVSSFLQ